MSEYNRLIQSVPWPEFRVRIGWWKFYFKKWMPDILPVMSRTVCFVKLVKLWHILSVSIGACAHVSIGACAHVPITRVVPRRNSIYLCIWCSVLFHAYAYFYSVYFSGSISDREGNLWECMSIVEFADHEVGCLCTKYWFKCLKVIHTIAKSIGTMNSDVALVCVWEKPEADILSFCRSYLESLVNHQFMSLTCGYRFFRFVASFYKMCVLFMWKWIEKKADCSLRTEAQG